MSLKITKLVLNCEKNCTEEINFPNQLTFIHGETATGKSSIARLIDFCLGGDFEPTPALEALISAELFLKSAKYNFVIKREKNAKQVQLTWVNNEGLRESRLVPIIKTDVAIFGEIYNLSDILLYLLDLPNVRIPINIADEINPVRLSFRDIFWYCYLKQDFMDSCFFNLDENSDINKKRKSRFVFRYITGLYTEAISELEVSIAILEDKQKKRSFEIENIRTFLGKFGYDSEQQLQKDIELAKSDLLKSKNDLDVMRAGFRVDTNFADSLREELKSLNDRIANEEGALSDIRRKVDQQESLKSELAALEYKLSRYEPAKTILDGVEFEYCPSCGLPVIESSGEVSKCILCKQIKPETEPTLQPKIATMDIRNRINELEESITKHNSSFIAQLKNLDELKRTKKKKDGELEDILKEYESRFVLQSRELERQIASAEQKITSLGKIAEMPKAVADLEKELISFRLNEQRLRAELAKQYEKRAQAEQNILKIEQSYKDALLAVSLPSFHAEDQIKIDRKTWIPKIIPQDKARGKWSFENIGSAGMKTLLNVCYALAIHKVALENNLPLPSMLILDSPSKNIDKEVNPEIFAALYSYIFSLSSDFGVSMQFLLIDNNYFTPPNNLEFTQRFMSRDDENNPRLIRTFKD
jgi:uncharacterized Zn finger protein (UPF0148 family)